MKIFFLITIIALLLSVSAMADSDSVAVFHRPEKVTILINEMGEAARLQNMMNYFDAGEELHNITADQRVMLTCGRRINVASCTFTFFKGPEVIIYERSMDAKASMEDLGLTSFQNFEINFESSMKDKFILKVVDGMIYFSSNKKPLEKL